MQILKGSLTNRLTIAKLAVSDETEQMIQVVCQTNNYRSAVALCSKTRRGCFDLK